MYITQTDSFKVYGSCRATSGSPDFSVCPIVGLINISHVFIIQTYSAITMESIQSVMAQFEVLCFFFFCVTVPGEEVQQTCSSLWFIPVFSRPCRYHCLFALVCCIVSHHLHVVHSGGVEEIVVLN